MSYEQNPDQPPNPPTWGQPPPPSPGQAPQVPSGQQPSPGWGDQQPQYQAPYGQQQPPAWGQPAPPAPPGDQPDPHQPGQFQRPPATGNGFSTAAIVLGCVAVLILPIVCGPVGLVLGGIGKSKGESRSTMGLIFAGVGMVLGFLLGIIVLNTVA